MTIGNDLVVPRPEGRVILTSTKTVPSVRLLTHRHCHFLQSVFCGRVLVGWVEGGGREGVTQHEGSMRPECRPLLGEEGKTALRVTHCCLGGQDYPEGHPVLTGTAGQPWGSSNADWEGRTALKVTQCLVKKAGQP